MLDVAIRRLDGQTVVDLGRTPATARPALPVHPALHDLLPRGLRRGAMLNVSGSVSLLLALLGAGSGAGAWCALVGLPPISAEAAVEQGIDLARLAIIPTVDPAAWATAVGALLDAVDIVAARPPPSLAPGDMRRLAARTRSHDAVLITVGRTEWPGTEARLHAVEGEWFGLEAGPVGTAGRGRLRQRRLTVHATGRGPAARPRSATLWLPAADGGVERAVPTVPAASLTAIAG
jgi:hypothetical protein